MHAYFGQVWLVRLVLQRALAAIYLIAFIAVERQFPALLGEHGLLPVPRFLAGRGFWDAPSLFHWGYSDRRLRVVAWSGIILAALVLLGIPQRGPIWLPVLVWLLMWALYLSLVNVGQTFFAFGWESMLLEAGFFAAFLGPSWMQASLIPVLALRWMLFRTELGAGLIKLRHDECWRNLTCLEFHYETQPLPNPLSRAFHRLPKSAHRFSVAASHFVQVVAPWGLFLPQPIASISGALAILQQLLLIVSGNYSWLNWITVALGFAAFSDATLGVHNSLRGAPIPAAYLWVLVALALATVAASIQPALNLFSRRQKMNYNYNPFHFVNTYGAFGSVTRVRYEVVLEATDEVVLTRATPWKEYHCKAKPGDPARRPPQVAPYHLRLDWLLWFLPFSVEVYQRGIFVPRHERWFVELVHKLLLCDAATLALFREAPFRAERRPAYVRALYYKYRFTTREEQRQTGAWWHRELLGEYLPPLSLRTFESRHGAAEWR